MSLLFFLNVFTENELPLPPLPLPHHSLKKKLFLQLKKNKPAMMFSHSQSEF